MYEFDSGVAVDFEIDGSEAGLQEEVIRLDEELGRDHFVQVAINRHQLI